MVRRFGNAAYPHSPSLSDRTLFVPAPEGGWWETTRKKRAITLPRGYDCMRRSQSAEPSHYLKVKWPFWPKKIGQGFRSQPRSWFLFVYFKATIEYRENKSISTLSINTIEIDNKTGLVLRHAALLTSGEPINDLMSKLSLSLSAYLEWNYVFLICTGIVKFIEKFSQIRSLLHSFCLNICIRTPPILSDFQTEGSIHFEIRHFPRNSDSKWGSNRILDKGDRSKISCADSC